MALLQIAMKWVLDSKCDVEFCEMITNAVGLIVRKQTTKLIATWKHYKFMKDIDHVHDEWHFR